MPVNTSQSPVRFMAHIALALGATTGCFDDLPSQGSPDGSVTGDAAMDGSAKPDASADAAGYEAPPPVSTAHCTYEPLPPTAHAGSMVTAGDLRAGAAESFLDLPVGSTLGAYTARARTLGLQNAVDSRYAPYSGSFMPSYGVERSPRVKALALTAGDETVVILHADLGAADDSVTADVAAALGPEFAGKVIFATSHSHGAWAHHVANQVLYLGFGTLRLESRRKLIETLRATAQRALDARMPARIGIAHEGNFDPTDRVNRDRRGENDYLFGGRSRKDRDLFVVRVDRMDNTPIAVVPVFGMHGTILGDDNNLASVDAPGAVEWMLEESFDRNVVVMHLQGAGGDVSPVGFGGIDCSAREGMTRPKVCYNYARVEGVGRAAVDLVRAAWERAGTNMTSRLEMEMVTRSVPLGPDASTFSVRGGRLQYAPFDGPRLPDGVVFRGGEIVSPIDEFNAPYGAGLCGDNMRGPLAPSALLPGTEHIAPYQSCNRIEAVSNLLSRTLMLDLPPPDQVSCAATRTTVSALRIGEHVFMTIPGEPLTLLGDRLRGGSPVAADKTVMVGYAQGHVGYVLTADDWLRGGYEPSINLWGPLEGEYIMERALELGRLVTTPQRENAVEGGATLWRPRAPEMFAAPDAAPMAGMVPATVPATLFLPSVVRGAARPTSAQPDERVPRLGLARFVWIGEDPLAGTPHVTLQREMSAGSNRFINVARHSGRPVQDGDLLLGWTPDPLTQPTGMDVRTHYWAVEWQAVQPTGTNFPDDLTDRPGVALGRYRFHVEGSGGYTVDSRPFTVEAGALSVAMAEQNGMRVLQVGYEARDGWRLLDEQVNSNRRVPLRRGPVSLTFTLEGGTTSTLAGRAVSNNGEVMVVIPPGATRLRVTDRHGNSGELML